jgi:hypothetical protein
MTEHNSWESIRVEGKELLEHTKKLIEEGNVRRVVVKHAGHVIAEFPLTAGVVGIVLAPMLAAVGAIAALVAECTVDVERTGAKPDASFKAGK